MNVREACPCYTSNQLIYAQRHGNLEARNIPEAHQVCERQKFSYVDCVIIVVTSTLAFTSGQWITEVSPCVVCPVPDLRLFSQRPGGSDVSLTETVASPTETTHPYGPQYELNGFKWFSSATDSDVAVALARTGPPTPGSRSLSLFLVPRRLPLLDPAPYRQSPNSNGIYIHRLKNKIGIHALPTVRLSLESTEAYPIGQLNQGMKNIIPVLNITRIYSAIASVGGLRKCLLTIASYSHV
jgi:Acyl-CoA dehydrogenase, middle domain